MTWIAQATGRHGSLRYGQEVMVSYLPLSHVAAQIADILIPLTFGATVHFANPDALKVTFPFFRCDRVIELLGSEGFTR